jgi:regulatory protein
VEPRGKRNRVKSSGPLPVTATYLRNAAMHYLSGRAASLAMLRQTLERRAKRRLGVRVLEAPIRDLIEAAVSEFQKLDLVDDRTFAEGRAATLKSRGLGLRRIVQGLAAKGVPRGTTEDVLAGEFDELAQARRFVERKRLGALRRGGMTPESRRKDLGALARAGFSFAIANRALETEDEA